MRNIDTISDPRAEYRAASLSKADVHHDPVVQFQGWLDDARRVEEREPTAMTLSTVGKDGRPSARVVLLKGIDEHGLAFFTNLESRKGLELNANSAVALTFWWPMLERQVRVEGAVKRVSDVEASSYFASRPLGSRVGAWASPQSSPLENRQELEARLAVIQAEYATDDIPLPPHWGGFYVLPDRFEFWQGRPDRLHDRIEYTLETEGGWKIIRLAP